MSRASHQPRHQRHVAPAEPPPCPRQALVDGLERCIGSFCIASAEFKAQIQASKYSIPHAHGRGHTLHDPLQSLSDMYRTQSVLFARNARLDHAVKRLASEMFDLLGIEHFRLPFQRYAQAVGLVHRTSPSQEYRYPSSGLPSPPRDIAAEDGAPYHAPINLAIRSSAHQDVPNRKGAQYSAEKRVPQFPFSHHAPLQGAAIQHVSHSPITSAKRSAAMSDEGRPSSKRHLENWPSTAAPFVSNQQTLRPTGKAICFEELFFERQAQRRQDISIYEGKFYVFRCDLHGEMKLFKTAHDARLHLARSRLHGIQNATLVDSVEQLGVEVLDCSSEQMESCNKISWQMRKEEKKSKAVGKSELAVVNDFRETADEPRTETGQQPEQDCESWTQAKTVGPGSPIADKPKSAGSELGNNPASSITKLALEIPKRDIVLESANAPTPRQPFANMEDGLDSGVGELGKTDTPKVENVHEEKKETEPEIIEFSESSSDSGDRDMESDDMTLADDAKECIEVSMISMYDDLSEGEIREEIIETEVLLPQSAAEESCKSPEQRPPTSKKQQRRRRLKDKRPKRYSKYSSPPSEIEHEYESRFCAEDAWRTKESPKRRNDVRPGDEFRPHGCVHCPRRFTFKSELKMHMFDEHKKKI